MAPPFQISCSIVTYNENPVQILAAAKSFLASPLRIRLTVVDNSPTDGFRDKVTAMGADYHFVGRNAGFAAGHNIGIRKHWNESEYHLILNPDVEFGRDVMEKIYDFMQRNPDVGLLMPRVLYPDGSEQRNCKLLPTPLDLVARRFGGSVARALFQKQMDRYTLQGIDMSQPTLVPCLSGCFMLVRTELFHTVGIFDERFFLYMEDFDLSRRIGAVAKTVFFPHVTVYHEHQRGSYKTGLMLRHHLKSAWKYFWKWGWFFDEGRDRLNERCFQVAATAVPAMTLGREES